ncbi:MAG: hypothetical protein ACU836_18270 [Gammaproteobacteria bacterium]
MDKLTEQPESGEMRSEFFLDRITESLLEAYEDEAVVRRAPVNLAPPGDCDWTTHNRLQSSVHRVCDIPRACAGRTGCGILSKYGKRNVRCAKARNQINKGCYRGGNRGHRRAAHGARRAANECRRLYRQRMCRGRDFYE